MKRIVLVILMLYVSLEANSNQNKDIYGQPYISSSQEHLYKKFDYFADTELMECNSISSPTICTFQSSYDSNLGLILLVLFIAFLIISGLIGNNGDGTDDVGTGGI